MTYSMHELVLGCLLHDVGKLLQRAHDRPSDLTGRPLDLESTLCPSSKGIYSHKHVLYTNLFFDLMRRNSIGFPGASIFRGSRISRATITSRIPALSLPRHGCAPWATATRRVWMDGMMKKSGTAPRHSRPTAPRHSSAFLTRFPTVPALHAVLDRGRGRLKPDTGVNRARTRQFWGGAWSGGAGGLGARASPEMGSRRCARP
jgi:hypothetical protein